MLHCRSSSFGGFQPILVAPAALAPFGRMEPISTRPSLRSPINPIHARLDGDASTGKVHVGATPAQMLETPSRCPLCAEPLSRATLHGNGFMFCRRKFIHAAVQCAKHSTRVQVYDALALIDYVSTLAPEVHKVRSVRHLWRSCRLNFLPQKGSCLRIQRSR